jgi:hypothetical protein
MRFRSNGTGKEPSMDRDFFLGLIVGFLIGLLILWFIRRSRRP